MTVQVRAGAIGQLIGAVSGAAVAGLWVLGTLGPMSSTTAQPSILVATLLVVLALFAAAAAIRRRPGVLLVIFALSFVPVGLYLIGVPHWMKWIGVLNCGYLASAWMLWHGSKGLPQTG